MIHRLFALVVAMAAVPTSAAVLDFESPLPGGLTPMSFWQGTVVPTSAMVTDQYLSLGIRVSNAALIDAGIGHAASGSNALGGIAADGTLNYDAPVTFSFFLPGDGTSAGTTDYFAYSPDRAGGSGNVVTLAAFAFDGSLVGQVEFVETGTFAAPLSITGIGQFHRVTVDQTLYDPNSGGIALDLITAGEIVAVGAIPEPSTYALMLAGLAGVGFVARRRRK